MISSSSMRCLWRTLQWLRTLISIPPVTRTGLKGEQTGLQPRRLHKKEASFTKEIKKIYPNKKINFSRIFTALLFFIFFLRLPKTVVIKKCTLVDCSDWSQYSSVFTTLRLPRTLLHKLKNIHLYTLKN